MQIYLISLATFS